MEWYTGLSPVETAFPKTYWCRSDVMIRAAKDLHNMREIWLAVFIWHGMNISYKINEIVGAGKERQV